MIEKNRKATKCEEEMQPEYAEMMRTTAADDARLWESVRKVADKLKKVKGTKDTSRMREVIQSISQK